MHMGNELLSLPVAAGFGAAAAAGVAYASARARTDLDERRVPLLGVLGAFVFAGQMVNFPVLPGTTGHLVGAALLAIALGPHAAALALAAIVIVQCLVFQDGGLLALGTNVFNMAIVGPYVAAAVFRPLAGRSPGASRPRLYAASFVAALASIVAGAAFVPLQVALSGVSQVPFPVFLGAMLAVHVVIGAGEGLITFAALAGLARLRPDVLPGGTPDGSALPVKTAAASVLAAAVLVGACLSLVAAGDPDGLEATLETEGVVAAGTPAAAVEAAGRWSEAVALFPDYNRPDERWYWTSVSGVLGLLLVLAVGHALGRVLCGRGRADPARPG